MRKNLHFKLKRFASIYYLSICIKGFIKGFLLALLVEMTGKNKKLVISHRKEKSFNLKPYLVKKSKKSLNYCVLLLSFVPLYKSFGDWRLKIFIGNLFYFIRLSVCSYYFLHKLMTNHIPFRMLLLFFAQAYDEPHLDPKKR